MKNSKENERTALTGVITGFIAVLLLIIMVITSNSIALVADLINTILEFISILIAWLTLKTITKSRKDLFNYGFGKLESLASFAIGLCMLASIIILIIVTINRFYHPVTVQGFGVLLGFFAHFTFGFINAGLLLKTQKQYISEPTKTLDTQRRLFAVKVTSNLVMFTALSLTLLYKGNDSVKLVDPIASVILCCVMLFNTWRITNHSIKDLMDHTLDESLQLVIDKHLAIFYHDYIMFHGVRSRYSGDKIFIEMFLEFDPDQKMHDVQKTINSIKKNLENEIQNSQVMVVPTNAEVL